MTPIRLALVLSLVACADDTTHVATGTPDAGPEDVIADVPPPEDAGEEVNDSDTPDSEGDTADIESDIADAAAPIDIDRPPAPDELGGERPARYYLPDDYTHAEAWPLVVLLHGYGASGLLQDVAYLRLSEKVSEKGFLLITPDGTLSSEGKRFWNATEACCDFEDTGVDDVAYITGLVDEAMVHFNVDPARVYLIGHSNGGFMSYRLACDAGDRFTALVSLAGAMVLEPEQCAAPAPVAVAQVHGTLDDTISYGGSDTYPSAEASAAFWADRNGCTGGPEVEAFVDLDATVPGEETEVRRYTGCEHDLDVQVWQVHDAGHLPGFSDGHFGEVALDFLLNQSRP